MKLLIFFFQQDPKSTDFKFLIGSTPLYTNNNENDENDNENSKKFENEGRDGNKIKKAANILILGKRRLKLTKILIYYFLNIFSN